ncbi:MAG: IS4 family transposase, partial [Pseudomonadota bacterium]|nr:IS4 family transposase [Pseudomonadota bacterium]
MAQYRQRPQDFTRHCPLTFKHLVLFLLNQPQSALQTELNGFFQQVTGAALESCQVTASAFCKARHKLDPAAFEALNQVVQAQLDAQGLRRQWRGLRLLAIDGSTVHLPLEAEQANYFGTHQGLPVARLSQLIDLGDGQTLHSLLVSPDTCERGCAQSHLDHAPSGSLILFDRGYPAHWLFTDLMQRQIPFVMRLRLDFNPAVRAFVQSGERETQLTFTCTNWLSRQVCLQSGVDPDSPVTLRLVRVDLSKGGTEVLAT